MAISAISRDWGSNPSIVRIVTNDSLSTILGPLYLFNQKSNIETINNGDFEWTENDSILITYDNNSNSFFQRNSLTNQLYAMPTVTGNQTRFNVNLSTPQTILSNSQGILNFDTISFDKTNEFNSLTSTFSVGVESYYNMNVQVLITSSSNIMQNGVDIFIYKNGVDIIGIGGAASLFQTLPGPLYVGIINCTTLALLNPGDEITCAIFNPSDIDVTTYIPVGGLNYWNCFSIPL